MANESVKQQITVENVRLSYAQLWTPKSFTTQGAQKTEPKYGATFLMDRIANAADIKKIQTALADLKAKAWPGVTKTLKFQPLRSGMEKADTEGYGPNVLFVSAKNSRRPIVVGRKKQPVAEGDPEAPYSGCYVDGVFELWTQNFQGGIQINASLLVVRFVRNGEEFGGSRVDMEGLRDLDENGSDGEFTGDSTTSEFDL